eukprot:TRINITY_DN966_c0_g1_i3.p1 TRINITY_DN966_c0_g1~~TRINITY_DN966_c0_g1_i3.p1  ORF type:complete len:420 (-),score=57.96 TRINITY_DN966_c0_g1_i3:115-1278(-)
MLMRLHAGIVCIALGAKMESGQRVVTMFRGPGCVQRTKVSTWTISSAGPNDLKQCTDAWHTSWIASSSGHSIMDLSLAQLQGVQALHLTCSSGTSTLGSYAPGTTPSCSSAIAVETFLEAEHAKLIAGTCATSVQGNSYQVDVNGLSLPTCTPGVTGDPHLTNLRGQKFNIHDGLHRLVHYPRGALEDEALLKVDANAVDMGADANCYAIFLDSVRLSGKWFGDELNISANTPVANSSASALGTAFASQQMDWLMSTRQRVAQPRFKGSAPVTVTTSIRNASTDTTGGEQISFSIGDQHPVVVEIWASHGQNVLTHGKDVRYLNVQVKNLPQDAGGIIGLDGYTKPTTSRCHFGEQVKDLASYRGVSLLSTATRMTFHWTAFATVHQ